jgi:alkylhydroperoxidase/carboxymuconolactone decarboxylase family protein YurZ
MTLLVSASCRRSRANRALKEGDILGSDGYHTPARLVPPDWIPDEAARRKIPAGNPAALFGLWHGSIINRRSCSDLQQEIAMTRDIYEDGLTVRRKMLGDAWVDRSLANRNDFNAEIQQQITRQAWGEVWTRPGIDLKTRRFMALSIMIALRAWDEFRLHVRSGLTQGDLTKDELKEIIIQATAYCGAPVGNHAMQQAELAFKEMAK